MAPAEGIVSEARNDAEDAPLVNDQIIKDHSEFIKRLLSYRDMLFQKGGYNELRGNHVILDHGNGEYSHLVHLKKSSVRVRRGDSVKQGDLLGLVGNSGLSNVPHLHYELVAAPDLLNRLGLPLRFTNLDGDPNPRMLQFDEYVRDGRAAR